MMPAKRVHPIKRKLSQIIADAMASVGADPQDPTVGPQDRAGDAQPSVGAKDRPETSAPRYVPLSADREDVDWSDRCEMDVRITVTKAGDMTVCSACPHQIIELDGPARALALYVAMTAAARKTNEFGVIVSDGTDPIAPPGKVIRA